MMKTFMEKFLNGSVDASDLSEHVDEWKKSGEGNIHKYLGLTLEEYLLVALDSDNLSMIAESRRDSFSKLSPEEAISRILEELIENGGLLNDYSVHPPKQTRVSLNSEFFDFDANKAEIFENIYHDFCLKTGSTIDLSNEISFGVRFEYPPMKNLEDGDEISMIVDVEENSVRRFFKVSGKFSSWDSTIWDDFFQEVKPKIRRRFIEELVYEPVTD